MRREAETLRNELCLEKTNSDKFKDNHDLIIKQKKELDFVKKGALQRAKMLNEKYQKALGELKSVRNNLKGRRGKSSGTRRTA